MAGTMTVSKDTQAMINARIGQIDQLISQQLNEILHHEDFQKLEASWRGLHYFVHQSETGTDAQDPGPERLEEGPAQGPGAGPRVRPERPVQEGLRGGVRHLRRRALRRPDRRLRVRPPPAGHGAAGEDLERRRGRARAVHRRGQPAAVRLGRASPSWRARATWPRSSRARSTSSGSRSATPRTRATSACACRTS